MTLSTFTATVRAHNRMWEYRLAAGWDIEPEFPWTAPCGTTESEWEDAGYPFPEDPDFAEWFLATFGEDPFPHATPEQRLRWGTPSVSLTPPS